MKTILNKEQKGYLLTILSKPWYDVNNLMKEKYGIELSREQIKDYRKYYHIKCEVKGLGQFKKGNIPHNKRPIGYEFVSIDNYTFIKVAEPNKYELKQRYIYEKHYGKIPKGYRVLFLDQDKTNFDINNLYLVRAKDILIAKNLKLVSKDKDITKISILTAKLINKTHEISKNMV